MGHPLGCLGVSILRRRKIEKLKSLVFCRELNINHNISSNLRLLLNQRNELCNYYLSYQRKRTFIKITYNSFIMLTLESVNNWIALILGISGVISLFVTIILWLNKKLTGFIRHEIQEIAKEFKPNGGTSLKDQVNRLEKQHSGLNQKVDEIYDLLTSPTKPVKVVKPKKP
jgi:hypothetical protein